MTYYRFVTPHRAGKWYADLETAKAQACAIGAGFLATIGGEFIAYRETRLEIAEKRDGAIARIIRAASWPQDAALAS